jgi:hypothetical protein
MKPQKRNTPRGKGFAKENKKTEEDQTWNKEEKQETMLKAQ